MEFTKLLIPKETCFPLHNIGSKGGIDFLPKGSKRVNLSFYCEVRAWTSGIRRSFNNCAHLRNKDMILPKIATRTEQERRVASLWLRKQSFKNSLLRNHLSLIICTFFCSDSALPPPSFPPSLRVRSPSHCLKTLETQP